MRFAKWVFLVAAIYGFLGLIPQYFVEERFGQVYPPPLTHPEFYYGLAGMALAWKCMFLVIARDPVRFRLAMLPATVEKLAFGISVSILFSSGRTPGVVFAFAVVDLAFAGLFMASFYVTPAERI